MTLWPVVLPLAAATYGLRVAFLLRVGQAHAPRWQRWLRFVPPAILAALIVPALLGGGHLVASAAISQVVAAALAALVAWRVRSLLLTVATGMVALWLMQALL